MPDDARLNRIVQRMRDAREPEDSIAEVIQEYHRQNPSQVSSNEPDTFWGGVKQSLTSGEALGASARGGLGYLKGAVLDLPSSIGSGLSTLGGMVTSPIETAKEVGTGLYNLPSQLSESFQHAGSDPEQWGRTMGQLTGQPLVTEGLVKSAPVLKAASKPIARVAGPVVSATGKVVSDYKPISGLIPRWTAPRTFGNVEGLLGKGITKVGDMMQDYGTRTVQGEVVSPRGMPWTEGEIMPETGMTPPETGMGPSSSPGPQYQSVNPESVGTSPQGALSQGLGYTEGQTIPPNQITGGKPPIYGNPAYYDSGRQLRSGMEWEPQAPGPQIPPLPQGFDTLNSQLGDLNVDSGFAEQASGMANNRDIFRMSQGMAEPSVPPTPPNVPGTLPPEFLPDTPQVNQPIPQTGGTSPTFTTAKPEPTFAQLQQRMYELVDKGTNGTLTPAELEEARALNKVWRNHPQFGADIPQGSFGPSTPKVGPTTAKIKDLGNLPAGKTIVIKAAKATPETIQTLKNQGFEFVGVNEAGDYRLTKGGTKGGKWKPTF
jgi:hypothetical protein